MKLGGKNNKNGTSISENNVLSRAEGFSGKKNPGTTWT
jgi:hypothetical protein